MSKRTIRESSVNFPPPTRDFICPRKKVKGPREICPLRRGSDNIVEGPLERLFIQR